MENADRGFNLWARMKRQRDAHPLLARVLSGAVPFLVGMAIFIGQRTFPDIALLVVLTPFAFALAIGVIVCIVGRLSRPIGGIKGVVFLAFLLFVATPLVGLGCYAVVMEWASYLGL